MTNPKSIMCKSCAKDLATILEDGLCPNQPTVESPGCDTCSQFGLLFHAMQEADREYAVYIGRRDTYRPKQDASDKLKKTTLEFNNWLLRVEAVSALMHETPLDNGAQNGEDSITEQQEQRSTERDRSSSLPRKSGLGCSSSNVRCSIDAMPTCKRLKFSDSVEFRDEYRPSNHFSRTDKAYIRGRHAPPEGSEYLDTSGSAKTFLKFTGMKKVGKAWVDVWTDEGDDEEKPKGVKRKAVTTDNSADTKDEGEASLARVEEERVPQHYGSTDARAQRLARRQNTALPFGSKRRRNASESKDLKMEATQLQTQELYSDESTLKKTCGSGLVTEGRTDLQPQAANEKIDDEKEREDASHIAICNREPEFDAISCLKSASSTRVPAGEQGKDHPTTRPNRLGVSSSDRACMQHQVTKPRIASTDEHQGTDKQRTNNKVKLLDDCFETNTSGAESQKIDTRDRNVKQGLAVRQIQGLRAVNQEDLPQDRVSTDLHLEGDKNDVMKSPLSNSTDAAGGDTPASTEAHCTPDHAMHESTVVSTNDMGSTSDP